MVSFLNNRIEVNTQFKSISNQDRVSIKEIRAPELARAKQVVLSLEAFMGPHLSIYQTAHRVGTWPNYGGGVFQNGTVGHINREDMYQILPPPPPHNGNEMK